MNETATELVVAQSHNVLRVEIDSAISTAKMYPRDVDAAMREIEARALRNDETAERCYYTLPPRKKKDGTMSEPIQGPSIRLLEIFGSQWGNLRAGARIINVDRASKTVTVQAAAHDLQTNSRFEEEVTRPYFGGDDGLKLAAAAAQSIGIRNVLCRVIGPAVDEIYEQCKEMVAKSGDPKDQIEKALRYFEGAGVTREAVLKHAGITKPEEATRQIVVRLRGLANAIREGYVTAEAAFATHTETTPAANLDEITERLQRQTVDRAAIIASIGAKAAGMSAQQQKALIGGRNIEDLTDDELLALQSAVELEAA